MTKVELAKVKIQGYTVLETKFFTELVNALKALVENEGLEAYKYLNKGIGTNSLSGQRWLKARELVNKAKEIE